MLMLFMASQKCVLIFSETFLVTEISVMVRWRVLLTEGGRELSKRCGCGLLLFSLCPTRSSVSRKAENADVEFLSFFFGGKNAFQMLTANSAGSHGQLIKY